MLSRSRSCNARTFVRAGLAVGALSLAALPATAQSLDRLTVPLTDSSRPAVVKAELVRGSITVKGYSGKEVVVEARLRAADAGPNEDKMKRIPVTTTALSARERDNNVEIEAGASLSRVVDLTIMVPSKTSVKLSNSYDGDISVTGVEGEMEIDSSGGAVTLKNVSGSAVAHAMKGKLLAQFDRVASQKPMAFSSLSGDLDLTFPADLKATLSITSNRGDVFTDFDVQMQASEGGQPVTTNTDLNGGRRLEADRAVQGTINGGGQQIQLKTYSGRIYIRKAGAAK